VSMFHRPVYVSITQPALAVTSVVKKYSSRCVPLRSRTYTHFTATRPCPDLNQCPVPLTTSTSRLPPPYQDTSSPARRSPPATSCAGVATWSPLTRGLPLPE